MLRTSAKMNTEMVVFLEGMKSVSFILVVDCCCPRCIVFKVALEKIGQSTLEVFGD